MGNICALFAGTVVWCQNILMSKHFDVKTFWYEKILRAEHWYICFVKCYIKIQKSTNLLVPRITKSWANAQLSQDALGCLTLMAFPRWKVKKAYLDPPTYLGLLAKPGQFLRLAKLRSWFGLVKRSHRQLWVPEKNVVSWWSDWKLMDWCGVWFSSESAVISSILQDIMEFNCTVWSKFLSHNQFQHWSKVHHLPSVINQASRKVSDIMKSLRLKNLGYLEFWPG